MDLLDINPLGPDTYAKGMPWAAFGTRRPQAPVYFHERKNRACLRCIPKQLSGLERVGPMVLASSSGFMNAIKALPVCFAPGRPIPAHPLPESVDGAAMEIYPSKRAGIRRKRLHGTS